MNPLRTKLLKCLIVRRFIKRLRRKPRRYDARPIFKNRRYRGETYLARELRSDPEYHSKYFRMTKESFDDILSKIEDNLSHKKTHSCPISPVERLAVTLKFLASGSSQLSVAMSFRILPSTISKVLRETMIAICNHFMPLVLPRPNVDIWKQSENGFANRWQFPNCCGALDGKHVRIQAPASSGSLNYNYKGYFSIVLMAIVDPYYKFIAVDIGGSGSISDGGIFSTSALGKLLNENKFDMPNEKSVGGQLLPHVIVGDDAFPLRKNLMKPYPGKFLSREKRIFNYRLSRARMVVECAFGIMSARWRILHTMIIGDSDFVKLIVQTCVVLHNYLITKRDEVISTDSWQNYDTSQTGLSSVENQGSNNYSTSAAEVRENFSRYFNNEGNVPWIENVI